MKYFIVAVDNKDLSTRDLCDALTEKLPLTFVRVEEKEPEE